MCAHRLCVLCLQPAAAETFFDKNITQHIVDTIGALHPTPQRAPSAVAVEGQGTMLWLNAG